PGEVLARRDPERASRFLRALDQGIRPRREHPHRQILQDLERGAGAAADRHPDYGFGATLLSNSWPVFSHAHLTGFALPPNTDIRRSFPITAEVAPRETRVRRQKPERHRGGRSC